MQALNRRSSLVRLPQQRGAHAHGLDYPATLIGTSPGGVAVFATNDLGSSGPAVAQAVLSMIDADLSSLQAICGTAPLASPRVVVANLSGQQDGSGGAYHWSCADTTWYCDCCTADPSVTAALAVAEAVESFEALLNRGWDCGDTTGEGLSRVLAENAYPGKLDAYASAGYWLDHGRPNFIDSNAGTDTNDLSNGCSTLFLWWLISLGYTWRVIVQAGGSSLAKVYEALTGKASAWADFYAACNVAWPASRPSGVVTDDPWTSSGGGGGSGGSGSGGGGSGGGGSGGSGSAGITLRLSQDTPAGTYMLLPVPAGYDPAAQIAAGTLLTCLLNCVLSGGSSGPPASLRLMLSKHSR